MGYSAYIPIYLPIMNIEIYTLSIGCTSRLTPRILAARNYSKTEYWKKLSTDLPSLRGNKDN